MNIDQIIAKNLDALMSRTPDLGSQVLLSKKTGVATSTVGRIRRGDVSPTADSLFAIAKAFGLQPGDLLDQNLIKRLNLPGPMIERLNLITNAIRSGTLNERQLKVIEATLELE